MTNSNEPNNTLLTFQQIENKTVKTGIIVEGALNQYKNIEKLRIKFTSLTDYVTIDDIHFILDDK